MSKRHKAKYKLDRQMGENIWGRPKSPVNKRKAGPGQHGANRGKLSNYGVQLRAKQKLKKYYGNIGEKQFRNIFKEALQKKGDTGATLVGFLESRLDALVYRAKFAPTIFAARQFVTHGHFLVNGKKVNIPSYRCKQGDVVTVSEKFRDNGILLTAIDSSERTVPEYIDMQPGDCKATYLRVPELEDIPYAVQMQPNLVIEFYSR